VNALRARVRGACALTAWQIGLALCCAGGGCCPPGTRARVFSAASQGGESGTERGDVLRGDASYYASFFSGRRTSSGERYDPRKLTAANRRLPFGTKLRVTRVDNGRSVIVRVNDRGPFGKRHRILDLSRAAAEQLDMIGRGHAEVEAVVIE
jgi:rare lipoprotein A